MVFKMFKNMTEEDLRQLTAVNSDLPLVVLDLLSDWVREEDIEVQMYDTMNSLDVVLHLPQLEGSIIEVKTESEAFLLDMTHSYIMEVHLNVPDVTGMGDRDTEVSSDQHYSADSEEIFYDAEDHCSEFEQADLPEHDETEVYYDCQEFLSEVQDTGILRELDDPSGLLIDSSNTALMKEAFNKCLEAETDLFQLKESEDNTDDTEAWSTEEDLNSLDSEISCFLDDFASISVCSDDEILDDKTEDQFSEIEDLDLPEDIEMEVYIESNEVQDTGIFRELDDPFGPLIDSFNTDPMEKAFNMCLEAEADLFQLKESEDNTDDIEAWSTEEDLNSLDSEISCFLDDFARISVCSDDEILDDKTEDQFSEIEDLDLPEDIEMEVYIESNEVQDTGIFRELDDPFGPLIDSFNTDPMEKAFNMLEEFLSEQEQDIDPSFAGWTNDETETSSQSDVSIIAIYSGREILVERLKEFLSENEPETDSSDDESESSSSASLHHSSISQDIEPEVVGKKQKKAKGIKGFFKGMWKGMKHNFSCVPSKSSELD